MSKTRRRLTHFVPLRRIGTYRVLHCTVLALGLAAMTAMSVPDLHARYGLLLAIGLWACLAFFALEWAFRIASAARGSGAAGYLFSGAGLVNAMAVLPIPIALAWGVPPSTAWLLGVLWLLKLGALTPGLSQLGRVLSMEAKPLASVLVIFLIVLFLAAVAIHVLERDAQPASFGSLPGALYWAVTTLTTTGYGDIVPMTPLGRLIAGFVMISGLGVFGLWTGILATGFVAESRRHTFLENWNLVTAVPFFRALDPAGVIEITRLLRRWDVPEHTTVVRRGRPGDCMYFIAAGEVDVEVAPHPVRLGAGAFFGELALLGGGVRSATVITVVPTTLLVLELTDFRTFTAHHPELARAVEAEAVARGGDVKTIASEASRAAPREANRPALSEHE